jgi:hypothetical protein
MATCTSGPADGSHGVSPWMIVLRESSGMSPEDRFTPGIRFRPFTIQSGIGMNLLPSRVLDRSDMPW